MTRFNRTPSARPAAMAWPVPTGGALRTAGTTSAADLDWPVSGIAIAAVDIRGDVAALSPACTGGDPVVIATVKSGASIGAPQTDGCRIRCDR